MVLVGRRTAHLNVNPDDRVVLHENKEFIFFLFVGISIYMDGIEISANYILLFSSS